MQDASSNTLSFMMKGRKGLQMLICGLLVIVIALSFCVFVLPVSSAQAASTSSLPQATIVLDGVTLSIKSAAIPTSFVVSQSDNAVQMASAVVSNPYREFQIEAIPFTTTSPMERLPQAGEGKEDAYRAMLHDYRVSHGGKSVVASPEISIFGKKVRGETNIVQLHLTDPNKLQTAVLSEYVIEAGSRIWLIRVTQEQVSQQNDLQAASVTSQAQAFANIVATTTVSSSTVSKPSTLIAAMTQEKVAFATKKAQTTQSTVVSPNALPAPSWWSGTCNYNNYLRDTGWESWKMNNGYNGVYPCGPRPSAGGPDHLNKFYSGAWGVYEFECVELSLRWMYLAYGVHPYSGNGKDIVNNYSTSYGGGLRVIHNTTECCRVPQPGDVLSYCSTCTYGHTTVAISTNVNSSGNGSITVMEENASYGGLQTLTVSNYQVQNTPEGWVYGYLHKD